MSCDASLCTQLQDPHFRFDWMPSAILFLLTAGCSACADVLSALLTIERPPVASPTADDFNAVLSHTSYWVPEATEPTAKHPSDDSAAVGDHGSSTSGGMPAHSCGLSPSRAPCR